MCSTPRSRQRELSPHQEARPDAEVRRLTQEVAVLRGEKRRLQESVRQVAEADCRKAQDLRRQHDQHEAELRRAERDGRRQLIRLVSELKAKDRVIARLKRDRRHHVDQLLRKCLPPNRGHDWVAAFCTVKPLPPQSTAMYKQLYLEHMQLQRAFCLLHQLAVGDRIAQPLLTWTAEKRRLESAVTRLRAEMEQLQKELHLARDDNDLLEFCVLELENQEQVSSTNDLVERGVNTDPTSGFPLEVSVPSQVKMEESLPPTPDLTTTCQDAVVGLDIKLDTFEDEKALTTFLDKPDPVADSSSVPASEKDDVLKELQIQLHHQEALNAELKAHCANLRLICNDLVAKVSQLESASGELSRVCGSETPTDLKLCAGFVSARRDIHRLSEELQRSDGLSRQLLSDGGRRVPCEEPDSIGAATSEDEGLGDESRRSDSTGPGSFVDVRASDEDLTSVVAKRREAKEQDMWPETFDDVQWTAEQDPESTVRVLQEDLNGRETRIKQLLDENSSLHKTNREILQEVQSKAAEVDALQERLETLEARRASLAEQVLELEEAENDARLESQQLQEKLEFLQEKDQHFQQELHGIRKTLLSTTAQLKSKEESEAELQSRINYMNVLIEKYEEQIHNFKATEAVLQASLSANVSEGKTASTGSQCTPNCSKDSSSQTDFSNVTCEASSISVPTPQFPPSGGATCPESSVPRTESCCTQTDWQRADCDHFSGTNDGDTPSESKYWDLCQRLHTLERDDVHLRGQLHQVDAINLSLWQKLHALEDDVERCRKENLRSDWVSEQQVDEAAQSSVLPGWRTVHTCDSHNKLLTEDTRCVLEERILSLECSEKELKERLVQLEKINMDFETELEMREKLHREKEIQHKDWLEKEGTIKQSIRTMEDEMETLENKVSVLEAEKASLQDELEQLREELAKMEVRHQGQLQELRLRQQEVEAEQEARMKALVEREAEYVRMITTLENRDSCGSCQELLALKEELESLRGELDRERAEVTGMKQDFQLQLDVLKELQVREESELKSDIEARNQRELQYIKDLMTLKEEQESLQDKLRDKGVELQNMQAKHEEQMKLLEEEHHLVEEDLKWKLKRMEENAAITTDALEKEKKQLEMDLEANVLDLRCKEDGYKSRITELERLVAHLRSEADDIAGGDGGSLAFSCFERERLMQRLQDLAKREAKLRERVEEMEQKEAAYKETLAHADKIVSSLERGYKEQIEELELSEQSLKQRVAHLEDNEAHLKRALHHERRSSDGRKPSDLVAELMEAEKRENTLKENVEQLQASQREMAHKIKEMEKTEKQLEEQLRDQDEMLRTTERLQLELDCSRKEATRLQRSESALQMALQQADQMLQQRDRQLRNEAVLMQADKALLEETVSQLRRQVRDLEVEMECGRESAEGERLSDVAQQRARTKQPGEDRLDSPEADDAPVTDHIRTIGELQRMEAELGLEVTVLQQSLLSCRTHLTDLESICRKQAATIAHMKTQRTAMVQKAEGLSALEDAVVRLQQEKGTLERTLVDVQKEVAFWREANRQLQEQANVEKTSISVQTTPVHHFCTCQQTQTESRWDKAAVGTDSRVPGVGEEAKTTPEDGMEARLQLEECMIRAMVAMQLELQQKAFQEDVSNQHNDTNYGKDSIEINSINMESADENSLNDWSGTFREFEGLTASPDVPLAQPEQELISGPPAPPANFRVLQEVGNTTLLVEWDYPGEYEAIEGFEIFVDGELHETVTSDRKKALISGVNLSEPVAVSICAVSSAGLPSDVKVIHYCSEEAKSTDIPSRTVSR